MISDNTQDGTQYEGPSASDSPTEDSPTSTFDSTSRPTGPTTGRIKDLLMEINRENDTIDTTGEVKTVDIHAFGRLLNFIEQVTGDRPKGTVQPLPLSTLRTMKLLYRTNESCNLQLFRLLTPPHLSDDATMEFSTTGHGPRNMDATQVITKLLSDLERNIDPDHLKLIDEILVTPAKFLHCIEFDQWTSLAPIYSHAGGDHRRLAAGFRRMGREINVYINTPDHLRDLIASSRHYRRPDEAPRPLDEQLYTYLRCLGFLHHVGEFRALLELSKIDDDMPCIEDELIALCSQLRLGTDQAIHPNLPVTSINGFARFAKAHQDRLIPIVSRVTGLQTPPRAVDDLLTLSAKVLNIYLIHEHRGATLDSIIVSVADCVAAMCAIRHEQQKCTTYRPRWLGQQSVGTRLIRHLQRSKSIEALYEEDYIPHGASQLIYQRFCAFHMAMIGQYDRYLAYMDYQAERLDAYAMFMRNPDIRSIWASIMAFEKYCAFAGKISSGWFDETPVHSGVV